MPNDLEEELRHRLRARAAGFDLAPGAVAAAAEQGRRRLRHRRTLAGSGMALVLVAGFAVATGWENGTKDPDVVAADGPSLPETSEPVRMITRRAGDADPSLLASISGVLVVKPNGCVALAGESGDSRYSTGIIWAFGWSAGREDGRAVVYNPSGTVFAREGDHVDLGGGGGTTELLASRYGPHPCLDDHMIMVNDVP